VLLLDDVLYPEGPVLTRGVLRFVEYGRDAVMAWDPTGGKRVVWRRPGAGPAAVTVDRDGDLWVTAYDANALVHLDPDGRLLEELRATDDGAPFVGPNDVVTAADGRVYFTASGVFDLAAPATGEVLLRDAGGGVRCIARGLHYANGLALSGDTLFVAEHFRDRVLAFDVEPRGALGPPRVFASLATLPGGGGDPRRGPDGMKVDARGHLYVAHFACGRVVELDPLGHVAALHDVPMTYVTNVALRDDELYVTAFAADAAPYAGAVFKLTR